MDTNVIYYIKPFIILNHYLKPLNKITAKSHFQDNAMKEEVKDPLTYCQFVAPPLAQMEIQGDSCSFNGRCCALKALYCGLHFGCINFTGACL